MITKPQKRTASSMKKSLKEMRECLSQSISNTNKKEMIGLKFSRVGKDYHIENTPVLKSDAIGIQLEKSFNEFMNKLDVKYSGIKIEGSIILDAEVDMFMVGYNDYEKKGKTIKKTGHSIDGIL